MRKVYENDTSIKTPKWYYKLSPKMVDKISDIGIIINSKFPKPKKRIKKSTATKRNVNFYL